MDFKINRTLLPMKAHYFLYFAGLSVIGPFVATYARQLGISAVNIGWILSLTSLVGLIVKPLVGFVADRFSIRKPLILVLLVAIGSSFMGMTFIRPLPVSVAFERYCDPNDTLEFCPNVGHSNVFDRMESQRFGESRMTCEVRSTSDNDNVTFHSFVDVELDNVVQQGKCIRFVLHNSTMDCSPALRSRRFACNAICTNPHIMHILAVNRMNSVNDYGITPELCLLTLCVVINAVSIASLHSLDTAMCFSLLGEQKQLFGKQRLWGSLGCGLFTPISGLVLDYVSGGRLLKDYSIAFYAMLFLLTCDVIVVSITKNVKYVGPPLAFAAIRRILLTPRMVVFFGWCIACGLISSLISNFLFWYLEEMAESSFVSGDDSDTGSHSHVKTLQGLTIVVQMIGGEVPMLLISGGLLKRIGFTHAMSMVLGFLGVRCVLYSVLTSAWWVLPIELLQGVTYGLFVAAMFSFANQVAPMGAESTMQGIAGAITEGIGRSVGGWVDGHAIECLGARMAFRWYGYAALLLCAIHYAVNVVLAHVVTDYDMLESRRDEKHDIELDEKEYSTKL